MFHEGSSLRKFSNKSKNFRNSKNAQNRPQKCPNDNFQNQKKFQNSKKAQNRSQKFPNKFWTCFEVIFSKKNFCPVFHGGSSLRKFSKKSQKFQNSKNAQNRPQKCRNVFWPYFGEIFSKKFFAQCSMKGRVFENFQINQNIFKIPKMPKIVPKSVQTCFEDVLGWFFRKNFCPVFHGGSSLRKFSKKSKNFQNSTKAHNRSQKCPNVFWRCFRVIFSKKFLPSVPWRVESSKIFKKNQKSFKVPKMPKIVPKSVQTKIFKIKKKFQKSKLAQNRSQKCPNVFRSCFRVIFSKKFLPSDPWRVESSRIFQKIKKISKFQECPKLFPKVSKRV